MKQLLLAAPLLLPAQSAMAGTPSIPERLVQYRSVDFVHGIIELHNYSDAAMPLVGWRTCTHNYHISLQYSFADALNGVVLEPGASLFIHMNNDALPGEPDQVNQADLGPFATPFSRRPYALELFWPNGGQLIFSDPDDMVDHVQWSIDGRDNQHADERSQEAVNAGLWTAENVWIPVTDVSVGWTLRPEAEGLELHGPDDYIIQEPDPGCNAADLAEPLFQLDGDDIVRFVTYFLGEISLADIDGNGLWDLDDISLFLTDFLAGCP
ncbi:MAG: hypothetical protein H6810_04910 [Phycisphaeraceae bacterium]|nr:MAG: hypothetical protein H6810_04910 [Phycisphaeraceae bacterium]